MNRIFFTCLAAIAALVFLASCESTEEAASLVVPDRDKEGFSGPGVRIAEGDQLNTNRLDRLTQTEYAPSDYLRRQQEQPVDGVDLFQYKKRF